MENSKEIEKLFYQDSYHKKKIGSNVHRRAGKGGERAGVAGGVRFAKNNFKPHEKNSRVTTYSAYEVSNYDRFAMLTKKEQKEVVETWLVMYTKEHIKEIMGIGIKKLNNIINELDVREGELKPMRLSSEDLDKYKEEIIPKDLFRALDADLKFEIVEYYQKNKGMKNKEIAAALGFALNTLNSRKTAWKNEYKLREAEEMTTEDNFLLEGLNESDRVKSKEEKEAKVNDSDEEQGNIFAINLVGEYQGKELTKKADALSVLFSDDSETKYKIVIKVEEL